MSKFLIKAAAIMAAVGLVLAACGNLLGGGDDDGNGGGGIPIPTGLSASASGNTVTLNWNSVSGATYKVYRSDSSSGPYASIATPSSASYTDSGLAAGTYYYKVSAYVNGQESELSDYDSATVSDTEVGKISGTVTLTEIPEGAEVYIYASGSVFTTSRYPVTLSGDGSAGTWTITLYESNFSGGSASVTGNQTVNFYLRVAPADASNDYEIPLESKTLDLNNKTIPSVDAGTASLKTVKLSGTIAVNDGGQAVPAVGINARVEGSSSSIGSTWLISPAAAGAAWEISIPAQQAKAVTFSVNVYDSASGGSTVFSKTFSPSQTASVSGDPISGIALEVGNISVGKLSGTVAFTNMPSPAPYRIYLTAFYNESGNDHVMNSGSSSAITLNGSTGSWTIPRDDDFLAALESGSQTVRFYLDVVLNQNESSINLGRVEKTVSKDALSGIDLGSIVIPTYIKLSGTFAGTYNGAALPNVFIFARTETGETVGGSSASISSPAASGAEWSLNIPAFDSPAKVSFELASSSGSTTLFNIRVSPSQTASVSNQPVSGININIGNLTPNTLRVENNPGGTYTAYVSDSSISQSNYSSVISGDYAANGSGSGSPVSLTWKSGQSSDHGYVLITAGSTTKYSDYVLFYNGIGSVDWNAMTAVSGSSGGAPSAPTGLTATASGTSVSLSWDSVSGASSYNVYSSSTSSSGPYSWRTEVPNASWTDTGLSAGTWYYKVSATVNGQESEQSSSASAIVSGSSGAPSAPTGLSASVSGTSISLSWNSVSGATIYLIYRSTSSSGSYDPLITVYSESHTDSGLAEGTYYYKVSAIVNGQESEQSSSASAIVSGSSSAPSAPTGLSASVSGDSVSLSWNSVGGASSYTVYRSDSSSGSYASIATPSSASYTDSDLAAGTYYYKVSAYGNGQESEQSDYDSATVSGSAPSAPTGLSASVSGDSVSLSWNSVSGATTYWVYRSSNSYGPYTYLTTVYTESYTDSGLAAGTYYYKVSAYGNGQESEQSGYDSATVSGSSGGGDTLAGAKGKLTLTGFNEFNGKYVYSALITTSGETLIGTNAVELISPTEARISMVAISGGTAEVPLYTMNASAATVADIYVPYEGSEGFQIVGVMILDDADGKFTASDAASFATSYVAIITGNPANASFTPSTSGGSITISRSDAVTTEEMLAAMAGGDYTFMETIKYMLTLAQ